MGVVYKAEDTKLKRTVALKFLSKECTRDKEAMIRFVQEAQAAAAADHPNVCTVYEINEFEGKTYIAMAYIQGQSLKEVIASGSIDIELALEIAAQIVGGLKSTHERGIIHRDIKPANIMLTGDGLVKIMDFGLAKLEEGIELTKTATIMGTVAYMSPEQAKGEKVDQRTDIWSLGCVLYEMLTGKRPFASRQDQAALYAIMNEEPEPLSKFLSDMDPELEEIVNKCLKKDLDTRYQQASDLLLDLQNYQKNLPISAAGSKQQKVKRASERSVRRLPWIAGISIVGILALIFMYIKFFVPFGGQRDLTGKMMVVLPFENLGLPEDEYFADGITEEITSRLAAIRE
ncbi:MAG: protein kinase, partial [Candidatus Aminicenantes bacterium]|nr:protein kinase [Candidatus Aminicenantes bacterium]